MSRLGTGLVLALVIPTAARADSADSTFTPHLSGYVQATYTAAPSRNGYRVPGRLIGSSADQFSLDQAGINVERAVTPRVQSVGFSVQLIAGTAVAPVKALGLDTGPDADLLQAAVTLGVPAGANELRLTAGKMTSMLGIEVVDPTRNPNLTQSAQFFFLEDYTGTGVDATWAGGSAWSAQLRVTNGWDVVRDPNKARTLFARVGHAFGSATSLDVLGYAGAEQSNDTKSTRSGAEVIARHSTGRVGLQLQLDAGHEPNLDAAWWGAGLWATYSMHPTSQVALRLDRIDDRDAARSAGSLGFPAGVGKVLSSATLTWNWTPIERVQIRPEARYDHADANVFDGHDNQTTITLGAACVY